MSLLTVIQKAAVGLGLKKPSTVWSSQDKTTVQLLALFEEFGQVVSSQLGWGFLEGQTEWVTTGASTFQGSSLTLFGIAGAVPLQGTFFDKTAQIEILASESNRSEVAQEVINPTSASGLNYRWKLDSTGIFVYPIVPAAHILICKYKSNAWVRTSGGDKSAILTADTDTFIIPEAILILGFRAYWRMNKGLPYKDLWALFLSQASQASVDQRTPRELSLDPGVSAQRPGIFVPKGSWNIP